MRTGAEADGFLAMLADNADLVIRAGSGRFAGTARPEQALDPDELIEFATAIRRGETISGETFTLVPLRVRDTTTGIIYLARPTGVPQDLELLRVLANQAAVAVQNIQLYEMAALDPLTGVYARRFFERWIIKQLRGSIRNPESLALLMIDIDDMKGINDTAGHLAGDQALRRVGAALRAATRASDVVGRYGGDEFAILMPHTDLDGAVRVGERILAELDGQQLTVATGTIPIECSLGVGVLPPYSGPGPDASSRLGPDWFTATAEALIASADAALYRAKKLGGDKLSRGEPVSWPALPG
jgi:diguanylate cyclase (GGDEF)-like protein